MLQRSNCRSAGIVCFLMVASMIGCSRPVVLGTTAEDDSVWVEIVSVKIDELEFQTKDRRFKESKSGKLKQESLQINVDIRNKTTSKKLFYSGWCEDGFGTKRAKLTDDHGNVYAPRLHSSSTRLVTSKVVGHHVGPLYPGDSLNDVLVFEIPVDNAKELTLELPKSAYNDKETGYLKLKFPMSSILKR